MILKNTEQFPTLLGTHLYNPLYQVIPTLAVHVVGGEGASLHHSGHVGGRVGRDDLQHSRDPPLDGQGLGGVKCYNLFCVVMKVFMQHMQHNFLSRTDLDPVGHLLEAVAVGVGAAGQHHRLPQPVLVHVAWEQVSETKNQKQKIRNKGSGTRDQEQVIRKRGRVARKTH